MLPAITAYLIVLFRTGGTSNVLTVLLDVVASILSNVNAINEIVIVAIAFAGSRRTWLIPVCALAASALIAIVVWPASETAAIPLSVRFEVLLLRAVLFFYGGWALLWFGRLLPPIKHRLPPPKPE